MSAGSNAPEGVEIRDVDVAAKPFQDSPASSSVTPATSEPTLRTPERLQEQIDPSGSPAERTSGESLRSAVILGIESSSSGLSRLHESLSGDVRILRCLRIAFSEVGLTPQDKENRKGTVVKGSNFTSEQLLVLSTLAVVAVLIVNVTYLGWAQPPGGATPYWQGCDYHYLFVFQLLNGIAFVLSMTAVVAVTLLPLTIPKHPRSVVWCGNALVAVSAGVLIAAFMFAGLVSIGYAAPSPACAAVRCNEGGVPCKLGQLPWTFGNTSVVAMDHNLAKLNGLTSPAVCFGSPESLKNPIEFAFKSDLKLATDVLCASEVPTTITQTNGLSSLNAHPQNWPFTFRPSGSVSDLLRALDPQTIVPFNQLRYICYSPVFSDLVDFESDSRNSSLCDTWAQVPNSAERLSVDPSGAYLTAATMLANGGLLFLSDDITIKAAGSRADLDSIRAFFKSGAVPFHGLDPKILKILAGVFASCVVGLACLVCAAHWSHLTSVMKLLVVQPVKTLFMKPAAELYKRVLKRGNRDVPQA